MELRLALCMSSNSISMSPLTPSSESFLHHNQSQITHLQVWERRISTRNHQTTTERPSSQPSGKIFPMILRDFTVQKAGKEGRWGLLQNRKAKADTIALIWIPP